MDIPTTQPSYVAERDGTDNVIHAIDRFQHVLADKTKPKDERADALKFLVHFVGDIHQPLHCAERNGDRGGNGRLVFFLERKRAVSLHSVWDTHLLRSYVDRTRIADYADQLDAKITAEDAKAWDEGRPEQWANESHDAARDKVYTRVPAEGDPPKLDQEYVDDARPVVEKQLERAGIRLADLLNRSLAPESATQPSAAALSPAQP